MKPRCALRILLGVGMLSLFSCQKEEFRIVEKADCFKQFRKWTPPDGPSFGWQSEAGNHVYFGSPKFHPYREATLLYYYYPDSAIGGEPNLAYYDFESNQGGLLSPKITLKFEVNQKDWAAYFDSQGLHVEKLNGDSSQFIYPSGIRGTVFGWSSNSDSVYAYYAENRHFFKAYQTLAGWQIESISGNSIFVGNVVYAPDDHLLYKSLGNNQKIVALDVMGDTLGVIEDPFGVPGRPGIVPETDDIFWYSIRNSGNPDGEIRMMCYNRRSNEVRQIRKSGFYNGYNSFSISPNGKYLVAMWTSWKVRNKRNQETLIYYTEPRIMDIEGCDERKLVLPEPR